MDLKRVKRLMTIMEKENLAELELEDEEFKVKITKPEFGVVAPLSVGHKYGIPAITTTSKKIPIKEFEKEKLTPNLRLVKLTSPMVGFFYHSQTPTSPPYVKVGDKITVSQMVGAVEVMGVINEIEAKVSGEIKKILVEDGHPVEYGQPLFLIEPEEE
ncbi:MAG: acetyl-CoA carboxylase biotin carboxyl carrier protein [bacterium]|nr:acetyl-CoA carboxylase biotin carboxyl carrier protein [bacterium]